jgi:hypothetical protein
MSSSCCMCPNAFVTCVRENFFVCVCMSVRLCVCLQVYASTYYSLRVCACVLCNVCECQQKLFSVNFKIKTKVHFVDFNFLRNSVRRKCRRVLLVAAN